MSALVGLVIVVALAGYIPFLATRLFNWLSLTVVPYLQKHPHVWTAVFLLLLLPPVLTVAWALGELGWRKRHAQRDRAPQQPGCSPTQASQARARE
jgi:hypothetical protein